MARPSLNYDGEKYGVGFELMPEGEHQMEIVTAFYKSGDKGPQWEMEMQPVQEAYRSKFPLKCWLAEDGCVNAIFDAAGADPRKVQDREYVPDEFIGKRIMVEIIHKKGKTGDKLFANIKRLVPVFTRGGKPAEKDGSVPF
jgi:hypothetical protein